MVNNALLPQLVPLLITIVGSFTILVIIFLSPIKEILNRFSLSEDLRISIGNLTIEAKTVKDLHRAIDKGFFGDDTIIVRVK